MLIAGKGPRGGREEEISENGEGRKNPALVTY
jgi:hypothetical protein